MELRINPGTNPFIEPADVQNAYEKMRELVKECAQLNHFVRRALVEIIEPAAYEKKNSTVEFMNAVKALFEADGFKDISDFYYQTKSNGG